MARLATPALDALTPAQTQVRDELLAAGGERALIGPVGIWLNNPELARRAASLGLFVARQMSLPKPLKEIAILVTARVWTSQYEWYEHAKLAAGAGVASEIIEAIKERKTPTFNDHTQKLVYDIARSLMEQHRLDDDLYSLATEIIGESQLLELIALLGMYSFVSITLNAFQVPVPAGTQLLSD